MNDSRSEFLFHGYEVFATPSHFHGQKVFITNVYRSLEEAEPLEVTFINKTDEPISMWWHDYSGKLRGHDVARTKGFPILAPGEKDTVKTFATHPFSS